MNDEEVDEPFSLWRFVRLIVQQSLSADPNDVTTDVILTLPAKHRDEALRQAVRQIVVQQFAEYRRDRRELRPPPPAAVGEPGVKPAAQHHPSNQEVAPVSRWKGMGDLCRKFLQQREAVGPDDWKFMADFDADDLEAAKARKVAHATGVLVAVERINLTIAALKEHNVKFVRDLPEAAIEAIACWQPKRKAA